MISYQEIMATRNRVIDANSTIKGFSDSVEYLLLGCHRKAEAQPYIKEFERIAREIKELNKEIMEKADLL